jgi:hypothetical protein
VLRECYADDRDGIAPPAPAAVRQDLALDIEGPRLYLLAMNRVRVGRCKECEVVARVVTDTGIELRDASLRISQQHAYFEFSGGGFRLVDKGFDAKKGTWRPSTLGTFIDGGRLQPDGGEKRLAPGATHRITFASSDVGDPEVFGLEARVWTVEEARRDAPACHRSPPAEEPAALVLRRLHGPAEIHILLRHGLPLSLLRPDWRGICLCREDGGFRIHSRGTCEWLVPGKGLSAGGRSIKVMEK